MGEKRQNLIANETLYQLSYDPIHQRRALLCRKSSFNQAELFEAVGGRSGHPTFGNLLCQRRR
jgi:hypothetical protein